MMTERCGTVPKPILRSPSLSFRRRRRRRKLELGPARRLTDGRTDGPYANSARDSNRARPNQSHSTSCEPVYNRPSARPPIRPSVHPSVAAEWRQHRRRRRSSLAPFRPPFPFVHRPPMRRDRSPARHRHRGTLVERGPPSSGQRGLRAAGGCAGRRDCTTSRCRAGQLLGKVLPARRADLRRRRWDAPAPAAETQSITFVINSIG